MRQRLKSVSDHLGRDELAVLVLVGERLTIGAALIASDKTALAQRAARDEGGSSVLTAAGSRRTRRNCLA
jgi:hypothetical protein